MVECVVWVCGGFAVCKECKYVKRVNVGAVCDCAIISDLVWAVTLIWAIIIRT